MKSVWVDPGNKPEWSKLKGLGIGRAYFAANDPLLTAGMEDPKVKSSPFLAEQRKFGEVGIYRDPVWNEPRLSPFALALALDADITRLGANSLQLAVSADLELAPLGDDVSKILEFITEWRNRRPTRMTEWTFEGEKAPLLTVPLAHACILNNISVAPELYRGKMADITNGELFKRRDPPEVSEGWCCETLLQKGFQEIKPFYEAARLPYHWGEPYGGTAFTQGRLP